MFVGNDKNVQLSFTCHENTLKINFVYKLQNYAYKIATNTKV